MHIFLVIERLGCNDSKLTLLREMCEGVYVSSALN